VKFKIDLKSFDAIQLKDKIGKTKAFVKEKSSQKLF